LQQKALAQQASRVVWDPPQLGLQGLLLLPLPWGQIGAGGLLCSGLRGGIRLARCRA